MAIVPDDGEKRYSSGSGETRCYVVEARSRSDAPQLLESGDMLDGQWRRIRFPKAPIGVKVQLRCRAAASEGYLDFAAANALAWWFMANAVSVQSDRYRALGIETRIVQVTFRYSFSATEHGVGPVMTEHQETDFKTVERSAQPEKIF